MGAISSDKERDYRSQRKGDPYLDRRSGEDRRKIYSLDYFDSGGIDRREIIERRSLAERRVDCVRVDEWSSVCPEYETNIEKTVFIIDH